MRFDDLKHFIAAHSGTSIQFGSQDQAPSAAWISRAEAALGCTFPPSYRWFLETYGGGQIHGDDVFSIYQLPFDQVVGGDVVAATLRDRGLGLITATDISICATDFGELFVLDGRLRTEDGECLVVRITGQNREAFADSFADFIIRFVGDAAA